MPKKSDDKAAIEESDFYAPYAEFAKTLRTWLIAYGIGVPALLVSTDKCWDKIAATGQMRTLGIVFLSGVAIQVVVALLYKSLMWQLYIAEVHPEREQTWLYQFAQKASDLFWPEFLLDILSFGLFAWATLKALFLLT